MTLTAYIVAAITQMLHDLVSRAGLQIDGLAQRCGRIGSSRW